MSIQGGVRPEKTFGRKIKALDSSINTLFGLLNSNAQVAGQVGGIRSGAGPPSPEADQGFIRRSGDQMVGALGFAPKIVALTSSEVIDIALTTINFTSRLIVQNGGGFKLKALDGGGTAGAARFNGQIMFLQGVATETIEIVHNSGSGDLTTGNFQTISGNNYIVQADEIIICQFDSTDNKWLIITTGHPLGSSPAIDDIDFATFDGINIDRLRFIIDSGAPATPGDPSIYLDSSGDMVFNVGPTDNWFLTQNDVPLYFFSDGNTEFISTSGVHVLELISEKSPPADLDQIGEVRFVGDDDAGGLSRNTYGRYLVNADDVSSGSKDGRSSFFNMVNNVSKLWMQYNLLGNDEIDLFSVVDMNLKDIKDINDLIPQSPTGTSNIGLTVLQFGDAFIQRLQLRQNTLATIRADGTRMIFEMPLGDVYNFVIDGSIYGVLQADLFEIRSFATANTAQYNMFQDVAAGIRAIGLVEYNANRTTGGKTAFVQTFARAENISNTAFEGSYNINVAEAGALVTYMSFNFLQEGNIRVFKPLDMDGFDLILDADGDSKFVLGSDDILTLNLSGSAQFIWSLTAYDIGGKFMQVTEIAEPAAPGATSGRIFLDSADNILKIRKSASVVSLEGAGGSQTPWASNIDADGFDLFDLSNIEFRTTTGAPAGSIQAMYADAGGIIINMPSTQRLEISVNNIDALTIDTSDSIFSTDILPNITGVRNLGSGSLKWSGIFASIYNVATSQGMKAVGADLVLETPTGTDIIFREVGTQFLRMDGGLNVNVFLRDIQLDGTNRRIRAFDATEIGYFVSNQTASVGAEGSIELPFTTIATPTDTELNTAFGNFDGACGVSGALASIPRWQVKVNANWNHVNLTNSN